MSTHQTSPTAGAGPEKGGVSRKLRGALIVIGLFPLFAALLLNAQADFDPFGTWINPLVLAVASAAVAVAWVVTGKRQR